VSACGTDCGFVVCHHAIGSDHDEVCRAGACRLCWLPWSRLPGLGTADGVTYRQAPIGGESGAFMLAAYLNGDAQLTSVRLPECGCEDEFTCGIASARRERIRDALGMGLR
jgi:hypothetical protein